MGAMIREAREHPISRAFGVKFPESLAGLREPDRMLAGLLARESGVTLPNKPAAPAARGLAMVARPLGELDIDVGVAEHGEPIGLDLELLFDGRLLIQGMSGAGKSWTLRRLLEQTQGRVQQIIIDPEGEFRSYADTYGVLVVDGAQLDSPAMRVLAMRIREHRVSIYLDLSQADRRGQLVAATGFFEGLVAAPREHWAAALVAVDEAHLFAPYGAASIEGTDVRKAAVAALTDIMSRGRKRGLCGVLATQRLARLAKSVVSESLNFLIGVNTLDLDIRRAAETIGWDASKAFDRLPVLQVGQFVAVGPAFTRAPAIASVGPVTTLHRGARPRIDRPAERTVTDAAVLVDLDGLQEVSDADKQVRDEASLPDGLKAVRGLFRSPELPSAVRIFVELQRLAPNGAKVDDIAAALAIRKEMAADALALLDRYGILEFDGKGRERAVRLSRWLRENARGA